MTPTPASPDERGKSVQALTSTPLKGISKSKNELKNVLKLGKKLLSQIESWSTALEEGEKELQEAQDNWAALASKLNSAILPNRIK